MFKITLVTPKAERPLECDTVDVETPALPRVDDYVEHEPSGINGYVRSVQLYWWEDGDPLMIRVWLK